MKRRDPNDIIDQLGGTVAVARMVQMSPSVVSNWRKNGIPYKQHANLIHKAAKKGVVLTIDDFVQPE